MGTIARILSVLLAATAAAAAALVAVPTQAYAAETRVVCNHEWVRIRAGATTTSAELGRLARGTRVTGTPSGSWFRLADGRWIAAYYTCSGQAPAAPPPPPPASAPGTHVVCRAPWVRVRAAATRASAELRRIDEGTPVAGTPEGSWLRLQGGGFIASYYACATPAASRTPLLQPTGTLGSPTGTFGQRLHPLLLQWRLHNGVDLGNRAGEPVHAAEAGQVTSVARDATSGLYIRIGHGTVAGTPRVGTAYLHLADAAVRPGQRVARGQLIGHVGSSGRSTKPHLHFMVSESGVPVDPEKYLGPLGALRP